MPQDKPSVQPGLGSLCSPQQQPAQGSSASTRSISAGLQHPAHCPFEPAPQPAQRQLLVLSIHLCFGQPCFTALCKRLMGKGFCQGREGGRAGGQVFLPGYCMAPTKLLLQVTGGEGMCTFPVKSRAFFFLLTSVTLSHQILR